MNSHLLRFDKEKKITFFDFETQNLNLFFEFNRPWQLAWLIVKGNESLEIEERKIKWQDFEFDIDSKVAELNHFDKNQYLREAIDEEIVFNQFYAVEQSSDLLIAHNGLGFDIYFLNEWYKRHGKNYKGLIYKLIDTNCLAKGIKSDNLYKADNETFIEYQYKCQALRVKGMKTRLIYLGKEMGIEHDYERCHDAKVDIELNKKVWDRLKFQIEI